MKCLLAFFFLTVQIIHVETTIAPTVSVASIVTIAGRTTSGYADGAGSNAQFKSPYGICQSPQNIIYVSDRDTYTIRAISTDGFVTLLAGNPTVAGTINGAGTSAKFKLPLGIDCDESYVYVADAGANEIRKVDLSGMVSSIAGGTHSAGSADGTGNAALFNAPSGIALSTDGTALYVADSSNNGIRKVVITSRVTITLTGGYSNGAWADGCGTNAYLRNPIDIQAYSTSIFFADRYNRAIRQYSLSTGCVTTLAGNASSTAISDGIGTSITMSNPIGIALDSYGLIYFTDAYHAALRVVDMTNGVSVNSYSIAGSYQEGISNVPPYTFHGPVGLYVSRDGHTVYICDTGNNVIRQVTLYYAEVPTCAPTTSPSAGPTATPSAQPLPTSTPIADPTSKPSRCPTFLPTEEPSTFPSLAPTAQPTFLPIGAPTAVPTLTPTGMPTARPTALPSGAPTFVPSPAPTAESTRFPTVEPSFVPSVVPTVQPTRVPTYVPSVGPSVAPSIQPTTLPTSAPVAVPTLAPTGMPTAEPTALPTGVPTAEPSLVPMVQPTSLPTSAPIAIPTLAPTSAPKAAPTNFPTVEPSCVPSVVPTVQPTCEPSTFPTILTTVAPTVVPSSTPSVGPTHLPSSEPAQGSSTATPTISPTASSPTSSISFPSISSITTLAGLAGTVGVSNGAGTSAQFGNPSGVCVAGTSGKIFISDCLYNNIRVINATGTVTVFAGADDAAQPSGFADDVGTLAMFHCPKSIACDADNIYVADYDNNAIRTITVASASVGSVTKTSTAGYIDGTSTNVAFSHPAGIAVIGSWLYVTDYDNNVIRRLQATTSPNSATIAGLGGPGYQDGIGTTSAFDAPIGIAADTNYNLYVADSNNCAIRKVVALGVIITTTLIGGNCGNLDGPASVATLMGPVGVALSSTGILYVSDDVFIRAVDVNNRWITTLAGDSSESYALDRPWGFSSPMGLALSSDGGSLLIMDSDNQIVRVAVLQSVVLPTAMPTSALPTTAPTAAPSSEPSTSPSFCPTWLPSRHPSQLPSSMPTASPLTCPTTFPTSAPSDQPSAVPSPTSTIPPTLHPTTEPPVGPSCSPTCTPTSVSTETPTLPTPHTDNADPFVVNFDVTYGTFEISDINTLHYFRIPGLCGSTAYHYAVIFAEVAIGDVDISTYAYKTNDAIYSASAGSDRLVVPTTYCDEVDVFDFFISTWLDTCVSLYKLRVVTTNSSVAPASPFDESENVDTVQLGEIYETALSYAQYGFYRFRYSVPSKLVVEYTNMDTTTRVVYLSSDDQLVRQYDSDRMLGLQYFWYFKGGENATLTVLDLDEDVPLYVCGFTVDCNITFSIQNLDLVPAFFTVQMIPLVATLVPNVTSNPSFGRFSAGTDLFEVIGVCVTDIYNHIFLYVDHGSADLYVPGNAALSQTSMLSDALGNDYLIVGAEYCVGDTLNFEVIVGPRSTYRVAVYSLASTSSVSSPFNSLIEPSVLHGGAPVSFTAFDSYLYAEWRYVAPAFLTLIANSGTCQLSLCVGFDELADFYECQGEEVLVNVDGTTNVGVPLMVLNVSTVLAEAQCRNIASCTLYFTFFPVGGSCGYDFAFELAMHPSVDSENTLSPVAEPTPGPTDPTLLPTHLLPNPPVKKCSIQDWTSPLQLGHGSATLTATQTELHSAAQLTPKGLEPQ